MTMLLLMWDLQRIYPKQFVYLGKILMCLLTEIKATAVALVKEEMKKETYYIS